MNELHPIQLKNILVRKVGVLINDQNVALADTGDVKVTLHRGTSEFSRDNPSFQVGMKAEATPDNLKEGEEPAFFIEVELAGVFTVDYERFAFEDLERWSLVNAPLLLLPFLREHLYGAAIRAGIRGIFLPLVVARSPSRES